jgi:YHS domain-containing protein
MSTKHSTLLSENPVLPPSFETICHRTITGDSSYFPQAVYHDQIIYFCTEVCLRAFLDGPDTFIKIHGREIPDE